jgi:hypothetical protein
MLPTPVMISLGVKYRIPLLDFHVKVIVAPELAEATTSNPLDPSSITLTTFQVPAAL